MFEKYFEISELLRHFYFLIGRLLNDNAAAFKAKGIVTKLIEEKMPFLENKKRKINETKQSLNGKFSFLLWFCVNLFLLENTYEASISLLNGILQLIQRAKITWEASQSS
jgi:hypothetical protein